MINSLRTIRKTAGPLKVAIVDPDATARARLNQLLSRTITPHTSVVFECSTAETFAEESPSLALDAIFVDITMPESWRLAQHYSPAMFRQRLVFVAPDHEYASLAFDLEAADFLTKPYSEDRLQQTVRRLWRHCRSPAVQNLSDALTERQVQILALVAEGLSNKEVARGLCLSHFTVRNHISQLFRLFGVSCRAELATVARTQASNGSVSPNDRRRASPSAPPSLEAGAITFCRKHRPRHDQEAANGHALGLKTGLSG